LQGEQWSEECENNRENEKWDDNKGTTKKIASFDDLIGRFSKYLHEHFFIFSFASFVLNI
jgi:hypothetical protein